jgi:Protein of unknown function (DUF2628)
MRRRRPLRGRSAGEEIRRESANYWCMDITAKIVLIIILFGLFVVFVWYSRSRPAYAPVRVGPRPAQFVEEDVTRRRTPPKLGWNWWAFFLCPIWFLAEGLWVHAIILTLLIGMSGGILWPFAAVYAGAKANETLADFRLARDTFY